MAKIKYSALVSDMRNKLNGSVLSKNRYGSYVRNKVTPVNPQTSFQLNQRALLSSLSSEWRSLTQSQRDAWAAAAQAQPVTDIFGDNKILSGQAFFVSRNLNLAGNGTATITNPGVATEVPFVEILSGEFTLNAGLIDVAALDISPATIPAGFKLVLYATPGYSPGISFVKNKFRRLGVFTSREGTVNFDAAFSARFGVPTAGDKVSVRCALVSNTTGQLGLASQIDLVVGT